MSSVGETLRRERLQKGLNLDQISRETKISTRLLDAIEKDQFDRLPGGVFAKSFVRQYAQYLALDAEELATEVQKAVSPSSDQPSLGPGIPEPAFKVPRVTEWEGTSTRSNSSTLPALALVVAVMLACSIVYAWWQRSRRPAPVRRAPVAHTVAPAAKPPAPAAPVIPAAGQKTAAPHATNAAPAAAPAASSPAALHVTLSASEPSWVHVWVDANSITMRTLQPGEVRTYDAVGSIRIRTGDAGALDVTVNGKPAGPMGPRGQIRIIEITPSGVQSLPPPPPSPAPAPAPEPL